MKVFIKQGNRWDATEDKQRILDAEEGNYVFAETSQDAADHINKYMNKLYPDFDIVATNSNYYAQRQNAESLIVFDPPRLNMHIGVNRGVELVKEHKEILVINSWKLAHTWEKESGKYLQEFGIIRNGDFFTYDLTKAKSQYLSIKKRDNYHPVEKKNYITLYHIERAVYAIEHGIKKLVTEKYLKISIDVPYWDREAKKELKKKAACIKFMELCNLMNQMFGKFSYRQLDKFQEFKKLWKEKKPISAKNTYVIQEFFDFMQIEITRQKPKARKLKNRWLKGGQRDGGK